jgi:hypothetical protein
MKNPEFLQKKFSFWNGRCTLSVVCAVLRGEGKRAFKADFAQQGRFCAIF